MYATVAPGSVDSSLLEPLSDAELVHRYKYGTDAAFEVLLARHADALFRFCCHVAINREDAEDICQETVARAMTRIESLQSGASFKSWLFSIARNLAMDSHRSRKRICALPPEDIAPLPLYEENPYDRIEIGEEHQTVAEALQKLAKSHQQVLMLREVEGLSYAAIARKLDVSQSAVETLLFRARRRLKDEYRKRTVVPGVAILGSLRGILSRLSAPPLGSTPLAAKVVVTGLLLGAAAVSIPRTLPVAVSAATHQQSVSFPAPTAAHEFRSSRAPAATIRTSKRVKRALAPKHKQQVSASRFSTVVRRARGVVRPASVSHPQPVSSTRSRSHSGRIFRHGAHRGNGRTPGIAGGFPDLSGTSGSLNSSPSSNPTGPSSSHDSGHRAASSGSSATTKNQSAMMFIGGPPATARTGSKRAANNGRRGGIGKAPSRGAAVHRPRAGSTAGGARGTAHQAGNTASGSSRNATGTAGRLATTAAGTVQGAGGAAQGVGASVTGATQGAAGTVGSTAGSAVGTASGTAQGVSGQGSSSGQSTNGAVNGAAQGATQGAGSGVTSTGQAVAKTGSGAVQGATGTVSSATKTGSGSAQGATGTASGVAQGATSTASGAAKTGSGATQGVTGAVSGATQGATNAVPGKGSSKPTIPTPAPPSVSLPGTGKKKP